jgi:hypothetical protein
MRRLSVFKTDVQLIFPLKILIRERTARCLLLKWNVKKLMRNIIVFSLHELWNVVIEWLKLLPRIPEVSGSKLGPETGYPD